MTDTPRRDPAAAARRRLENTLKRRDAARRESNTPRASAEYVDGARVKFTFPCGHYRTETLLLGPRGHRRPMSPAAAKQLASYWGDGGGVAAGSCPTCRGSKRPDFSPEVSP